MEVLPIPGRAPAGSGSDFVQGRRWPGPDRSDRWSQAGMADSLAANSVSRSYTSMRTLEMGMRPRAAWPLADGIDPLSAASRMSCPVSVPCWIRAVRSPAARATRRSRVLSPSKSRCTPPRWPRWGVHELEQIAPGGSNKVTLLLLHVLKAPSPGRW